MVIIRSDRVSHISKYIKQSSHLTRVNTDNDIFRRMEPANFGTNVKSFISYSMLSTVSLECASQGYKHSARIQAHLKSSAMS